MPDQMLEIGTRVDASGISSGMQQSATAVQQATSQMTEGFGRVRSTSQAAAQGQAPLIAATQQLTLATQQLNATLQAQAPAANGAATATRTLTQATNGQTTATRGLTIEQRRQYEEFVKLGGATHSAVSGVQATSAAIRSLEGNAGIRAVENFVAKTLGLGPAMQMLFPIIGALAFGKIVFDIGEKVYEVWSKTRAAAAGMTDAFEAVHERVAVTNDELRLTSDRLQMAIDKLEGHPGNGALLALDEARKMADQLAVALRNDRKELEDLLKENDVTAFGNALTGIATTGKQHEEMIADQKTLTDEVAEANRKFREATDGTQDAAAIKRAGDIRDTAIKGSYQKQIDSYKRESGRLADEQSNSVTINAKTGMSEGPQTNNSVKIAGIDGRRQQLEDALANENLQIKVAGQTAVKNQLDQDKELARAKKESAREAASEARQAAAARRQAAAEQRREEQEQVRAWQDDLTQKHLASGAFYSTEKADDAAYWKAVLDTHQLSTLQRREVDRVYLTARNEAERQALGEFVAGKKAEAGEAERTSEQIILDYMAIADAMEAAYGKGSRQASDAQRELARAIREVNQAQEEADRKAAEAQAKQRRPSETAQTGRIAVATSKEGSSGKLAKEELEAGILTQKQYEAAVRESEEAAYRIKLDALQKRRALEALDPNSAEEMQRTDNEVEKLTADHEARLTAISQQQILARAKQTTQFFTSIGSGMGSALSSWERGQGTFLGSWEKTMGGMVSALQQKILQMGAMWLAHYAQQRILHVTTNLAKTASDQVTAAVAITTTKAQGAAQSTTAAVTAFKNTYASVSAIPVIGPALAPVAAAGAFVAVEAFSAQGGWDRVPYDGAMTELHKDEMVMPANLSDRIRGMTSNSQSVVNQFGGNTFHGGSGSDFPALLDQHEDRLASKVSSLMRDGKIGG